MDAFAMDLPHFGTVIWKQGMAYQLRADAKPPGSADTALALENFADPMALIGRQAITRLAGDIARGTAVTLHAEYASTLRALGLTPKKVPQTFVAGSAESELAHATEFYSAVVYASEFTTLWTQLRATRARIDLTPSPWIHRTPVFLTPNTLTMD